MTEFIIRDRVITKYNGCKKVVHIPYGVTEIGQSAFMDHNEIESVTLPDSITGIGANAFFGCDAIFRKVSGKSMITLFCAVRASEKS